MAALTLFIGGGHCELRNGHIFVKAGIGGYITSAQRRSGELHWVARCDRGVGSYTTVCPKIAITEPTLSLRQGPLRLLVRLLAEPSPACVALLHLPNPWSLLFAPILRLRGYVVILYLANDWVGEATESWHAKRRLRVVVETAATLTAIASSTVAFGRSARSRELVKKLGLAVKEAAAISDFDFVTAYSLPAHFSSGKLEVLFVGKVSRRKGVDVLIKALSEYQCHSKAHNAPIRLTIVGSGEDRSALELEASELGVAHLVTFAGYVDQGPRLIEIMHVSDCIVVPSTAPEGFPRVIEEASAIGKPLIVAMVPGLAERLAAHGGVKFVQPGDFHALALMLENLASDSASRASLGAQSRQWAQQNLSSNNASEQHWAVAEHYLAGAQTVGPGKY